MAQVHSFIIHILLTNSCSAQCQSNIVPHTEFGITIIQRWHISHTCTHRYRIYACEYLKLHYADTLFALMNIHLLRHAECMKWFQLAAVWPTSWKMDVSRPEMRWDKNPEVNYSDVFSYVMPKHHIVFSVNELQMEISHSSVWFLFLLFLAL